MLTNDIVNRNTAIKGMFFTGMCSASCGVLVALLQEKTGISYSQAGVILSSLSLGQVFSSFMAGILPAKIGLKKTVNIMGIGIFLGYILLTLTSVFKPSLMFYLFVLAFVLAGIGKGSTINVSNLLSAKTNEPTKNLNLENAAFAFGALLSPFIVSFFGSDMFVWWTPMLIFAFCGALLSLVFFKADLPKAEKKTKINDFSFLKKKRFWNVTVMLFCQQCIEVGVTGWLVTYFKDTGILTGLFSQMTVSLIWTTMMIIRLWIAFKYKGNSLPKLLIVMGLASMISYLGLLLSDTALPAIICLGLFGLSIGSFYPVIIASAGNILSSESMGIMLPIGSVGAVTMPSVMGFVAGFFGIHAGMLVIMFAIVVFIVSCFIMLNDDRKSEKLN